MRFVIAGCGDAKRDRELEPGSLRIKRYPAKDLYTSTYFGKKREFAETVGDQWMILSALHGLLPPGEAIKPYDVAIDDLDDERLDQLAHQVGMTLIEWVAQVQGKGHDVEEIVVLAGTKYLDPLRERDAFYTGTDVRVSYPFQQHDFGGIGGQMAWLKERVDAHQQTQTRLETDGGPSVSTGNRLEGYCRRGRRQARQRAQHTDNELVANRLDARASAFDEVLERLQEADDAPANVPGGGR